MSGALYSLFGVAILVRSVVIQFYLPFSQFDVLTNNGLAICGVALCGLGVWFTA